MGFDTIEINLVLCFLVFLVENQASLNPSLTLQLVIRVWHRVDCDLIISIAQWDFWYPVAFWVPFCPHKIGLVFVEIQVIEAIKVNNSNFMDKKQILAKPFIGKDVLTKL